MREGAELVLQHPPQGTLGRAATSVPPSENRRGWGRTRIVDIRILWSLVRYNGGHAGTPVDARANACESTDLLRAGGGRTELSCPESDIATLYDGGKRIQ